MENAIIKLDEKASSALVNASGHMTALDVVNNTKLIKEIMESVMIDGTHYGKVPGCGEKPTLLKPGSEKLSMAFRLAPKYIVNKTELGNGHREYEVITEIYHIESGKFLGQGVGSCSTYESKFRYRNSEPTSTGKPLPKTYWDAKKANDIAKMQEILGGKGFIAKKNDDANSWEIFEKGKSKVEYENPADYYNTILKIAKKRSQADAILTVTAASDVFTQDLEDLTENQKALEIDYIEIKDEPKENNKSEENKKQESKPESKINLVDEVRRHLNINELNTSNKVKAYWESIQTTYKTASPEIQKIVNKEFNSFLEFIASQPKQETKPENKGTVSKSEIALGLINNIIKSSPQPELNIIDNIIDNLPEEESAKFEKIYNDKLISVGHTYRFSRTPF